MASKCPVCGKGIKLKRDGNGDPSFVYCTENKPEKRGDNWVNTGSCDFRLFFNQKKIFNTTLSDKDMKKLLEGGSVVNAKGDVMEIDVNNKEHFTKFDFKEDEEF